MVMGFPGIAVEFPWSSGWRRTCFRLVSVEKAKASYGVVIDKKTMKADRAATGKLRAELKAKRGEPKPALGRNSSHARSAWTGSPVPSAKGA